MPSPRTLRFLVLLFVLLLAALACNMPGRTPAPTEDTGLLYTSAAQTLEAQITEQANPSGTQPPLAQPGDPTATNPPPPAGSSPTFTPAITNTPFPTNTPVPSNTPTQIPCDKLEFVKDVTINDGTEIAAGEPFEKIWRLKNVGSCTWTSGYQLVFFDGDQMDAPDSQQLTTSTVAPGQTVDVSVDLTAPIDPGTYKGNFKLRNPGGVAFGWGPENKAFWVEIEVPSLSGVLFDFLAEAKNADWGSGVAPVDFAGPGHTSLTYGGPDTDTNGFAMIKDGVKLETGKDSAKILETHPKWENDGYIVGEYPTYKVGTGDYIKGQVGFIANTDGSCGNGDVIFEIHYTKGTDLGTRTRLGQWSKTCDGKLMPIEVSLTALKGETVHFFLVVLAHGAADQDWAIWSSLGVMRD